jgi:two-component system, NtrC family, sensor histidine kinase PilS
MKGYLDQLRQLTILRLLIFIFFLLLVQNGFLGVAWSQYVPLQDIFIYLFSGFLISLSLFYLYWLNRWKNLGLFTRVQCALDPVLITILIITTGGLNSPFYFLFGVAILNTAFLLGQRQAFLMAGMILICSVGLVTLIPLLQIFPFQIGIEEINRLVFQGIAFILTALLAGALARRIGGIQKYLAQQTDSLAGLTSLHHQIIQALPHALVSTNLQGIIRDANPGAEKILGISVANLQNRSLEDFFPAMQWAINQMDRDNVYLEFRQNEQILGINISILINQQNQNIGSLLFIRDLTTIKILEQKLANQEKLSLTGQMAAGVAHEIRNPLASILSAAQMFGEEKPRDKKLKRIIIEEVGRLKQLTTDFLVYSKPPVPTRQSIILSVFIKDLLEQVKCDPHWGDKRKLTYAIPRQATLLFDVNQLRQVFWNLLINSAQAALDGGEITITLEPSTRGQNQVIVVEDDGPGLDNDLIAKLQEPFFTTRSDGTGLGLAVVTQLVRLNGGDIHLQPGKNGGLRVLLTVERGHG